MKRLGHVLMRIGMLICLSAQGGTPVNPVAYRADQMGANSVDCTGAADSAAKLQRIVNAIPDGATVEFPLGCVLSIGSTISITDRVSLTFRSAVGVQDGGNNVPKLTWIAASGGPMFDVEHTDRPAFIGLNFTIRNGGSLSSFLNFDGQPATHVGTSGLVRDDTFNASNQNNARFIAVNISQRATANHENYVVEDSTFFCSGSQPKIVSYNGATTSSSPTLDVSPDAPFTAGVVGKTVWVSSSTQGLQKTSVIAVIDKSHATLAANAVFTGRLETIAIDQAFGIGVRNGASQNALQQQFRNNGFFNCDYGIYIAGGNVAIDHIGGTASGYSDYGVYVAGFATGNIDIDFYQSENDLRGIEIASGVTGMITINHTRLSNGAQLADGFLKLGSPTILENTQPAAFPVPSNSVLIGFTNPGSAGFFSFNNNFNVPWALLGYSTLYENPHQSFVSINDGYADTATPAANFLNCFSNAQTCLGVRGHVVLKNLPTADPHVQGELWNNKGVLNISGG